MIKCQFENGSNTNLRHVVVGAIALNKNRDKVLLVKRAPSMLSRPNKYTVPGGFLDRDEDTKKAALRELLEETGYKGKILSLFHIKEYPDRINEDRQNIDFLYLIEVGEKIGEYDNEVSEVKWFDLNNVPKKEDWAFDHLGDIQLYKKHLKIPFKLPIVGKVK